MKVGRDRFLNHHIVRRVFTPGTTAFLAKLITDSFPEGKSRTWRNDLSMAEQVSQLHRLQS